jgi:four helix bundle protein
MKENAVRDKSFAFALRTIGLHQMLVSTRKEYILSKQVLRSGTAVGALVREADYAESRADFIHKMAIALKEANETGYRIELLHQSGYIDTMVFASMDNDLKELLKLLTSIIKSARTSRG